MVNRRFKHFLTVWIVAIVSFNIIYFILESNIGEPKFDSVFWITSVFANIIIVGYLFIGKRVFSEKELTNFYYRLSELRIAYIGSIVTIVISIIFVFLENLQRWVGTIICIVLFSIIYIYIVKADAASTTVQEIDKALENKINTIKDFTKRANNLYKQSENKRIKESLKILCNEFKFSNYSFEDEDNNRKMESYMKRLESKKEDEIEVNEILKEMIKMLRSR